MGHRLQIRALISHPGKYSFRLPGRLTVGVGDCAQPGEDAKIRKYYPFVAAAFLNSQSLRPLGNFTCSRNACCTRLNDRPRKTAATIVREACASEIRT